MEFLGSDGGTEVHARRMENLTTLEELKTELLADPDVRREYEALQSTDLVRRLRDGAWPMERFYPISELMREAANEVEKLRKKAARLELEVRSLVAANTFYDLDRAKGLALSALERCERDNWDWFRYQGS